MQLDSLFFGLPPLSCVKLDLASLSFESFFLFFMFNFYQMFHFFILQLDFFHRIFFTNSSLVFRLQPRRFLLDIY